MINATELRKGMVIKMDNDLYVLTKVDHVTPGNWRAMIQCTMKSIEKGNSTQKRLSAKDRVEDIYLDHKEMEYLYEEAGAYVFMDIETYEQITIQKDFIGDSMGYIPLNSRASITFHDARPVAINLPASVVLTVTETEPGAKGDTRTNVFKPAKTETGLVINVPLYLKQGEKIKVDTRTGEFLERVN